MRKNKSMDEVLRMLQAKEFIYNDLQREINLSKVSETTEGKETLEKLIGFSGGGNFMAALSLLCYTEFAGKLKYDKKKSDNKPSSSGNFNAFFDDLGEEYKKFKEIHDVYNIFRCGLAHEYYVKKSCCISMLKGKATCGIGQEESGKYYFVVEKYFEDFKKAFDAFLLQVSKSCCDKLKDSDDTRYVQNCATTLSVQSY